VQAPAARPPSPVSVSAQRRALVVRGRSARAWRSGSPFPIQFRGRRSSPRPPLRTLAGLRATSASAHTRGRGRRGRPDGALAPPNRLSTPGQAAASQRRSGACYRRAGAHPDRTLTGWPARAFTAEHRPTLPSGRCTNGRPLVSACRTAARQAAQTQPHAESTPRRTPAAGCWGTAASRGDPTPGRGIGSVSRRLI
jgi:hypothetical protein